MGIGNTKKKILTNEEIEISAKHNQTLEKFFNLNKNYEGFIDERVFEFIILGRKLEGKISHKLFNFFSSDGKKMNLSDLKYFYAMFITKSYNVKLSFVTNLIFFNRNELQLSKYARKVNLFFNNEEEIKEKLTRSSFISKVSQVDSKDTNKIIVVKEKFHRMLDYFCKDFISDRFLFESELDKRKFSSCNCFTSKSDTTSSLNEMEREFIYYQNKDEGLFTLYILETMMLELDINPKIIQVLCGYLRRKTQKNFLDFKTFQNFLTSLNGSVADRINFLFEILSYPNIYIDIKQLKSLFWNKELEEIIDANFKNKILRGEFTSVNWENTFVFDVLHYLERVMYLPYLYFKVIPNDKQIEKNCVLIVTKGIKKMEEYVMNRIPMEDEFYCVTTEFWKDWVAYVGWDDTPVDERKMNHKPRIDNTKIKGEYSNTLRIDVSYGDDFVIIPSSVYNLFKLWYPCIDGEIKLCKITYDKKNHPTRPGALLLESPSGIVQEIEFYPIVTKYFTSQEIYNNISETTQTAANNLLTQLYENKLNLSRQFIYPRKTSFWEIKNKLDKEKNLQSESTRIWTFYKNYLKQVDLDSTLEKEGLSQFCLILVDIMKDGIWYFDLICNSSNISLNIMNKKKNDSGQSIYPIGFDNIGNTCYMNSILQAFLNSKIIKETFLNKNFPKFINYNNKFGRKGKVIKEFMRLLDTRWQNTIPSESLRPNDFKQLMGSINPQFANFDQQDACEFLNFLLDELHEEINLKNEREYISNPEHYLGSDIELGNEYWANNLRRSASFIHSLFLSQLRSNLTCCKCGETKLTFETNTTLSFPIPQKRTINIDVILHRLPFNFKVYYCDKGVINLRQSLKLCRKQSLDEEKKINEVKDSRNNIYQSKLVTAIPIKLSLEVDRNAKVDHIIRTIREIKELELESFYDLKEEKKSSQEEEDYVMVFESKSQSYKQLTHYVITSGHDNTFIDDSMTIDEYFTNGQTVNVYELMNTVGVNKFLDRELNSELIQDDNLLYSDLPSEYYKNKVVLMSYQILNHINTKPLTLGRYITHNPEIAFEYVIEITHRKISQMREYLFNKTGQSILNFKSDFILINSYRKYNYNAKFLYDFIWEKFQHVLNEPTDINRSLWWHRNENLSMEEKLLFGKTCSPFVIKILSRDSNGNCSQCSWFNFCPGCVLNPFDENPIFIKPNCMIVVEWCNDIVKNFFDDNNVGLIFNHESCKAKKSESTTKTLLQCIELFLEKEYLEEKLKCERCNSIENFYKKYDFERMPPILCISLKRFKFAKMYRKKIDNLIEFPINDLNIKNVTYSLYGVINHTGSLTAGHYTSILRLEDKWFKFDDSRYYEIDEKFIITPAAYILFYVQKNKIANDYHTLMNNIMNSIDKDSFNECTFIKGEPVCTPYGRGYVTDVNTTDEDTQIVGVKFKYGSGYINALNVKKELFLQISSPPEDIRVPEKKITPPSNDKDPVRRDSNSNCFIY